MPLTPEGITLLQRVKERILAEPQAFAMHSFFDSADFCLDIHIAYDQLHEGLTSCGTTACIAGWILVLSDERPGHSVALQASAILGVDGRFNDLFYAENWPEDLCDRYGAALTDRAIAEVASDAIDRWIAGNGSFDQQGAEV